MEGPDARRVETPRTPGEWDAQRAQEALRRRVALLGHRESPGALDGSTEATEPRPVGEVAGLVLREALCEAWRRWDELPGSRERVIAFEAARKALGVALDDLTVYRRLGIGRWGCLAAALEARQPPFLAIAFYHHHRKMPSCSRARWV